MSPAAVTPYPSYPFLRLGSKGDFVAWAQQLLAGAGYSVPISGYFQGSTQAALYSFQTAHGLPQTGNLDVPTWSVLLQSDPLPVRWTKGGAVAAGSGRAPGAAAAALGEAARGAGRDPASRQARQVAHSANRVAARLRRGRCCR